MKTKRFKIHKKSLKKESADDSIPNNINLTSDDEEIRTMIEQLHDNFAKRGLAYLLVAQTPSGIGSFTSFTFENKENDANAAQKNAEWILSAVGGLISRVTKGMFRLIRYY